jgi:hypothetical protein
MLDFTTVSREIRSLISRRRELLTFLGSVFAAMGLFLQNVLQGSLPESLNVLRGHVFAVYAFLLMVPSLILALRLARLNAGMTLNGVLYQRLMQEQDFTRKGTLESRKRSARMNVFGVSFLMFLLADLIAGFAAALLALALATGPRAAAHVAEAALWLALAAGVAVVLLGLGLYVFFHHRAAAFALRKAETDGCAPFTREQWEEHSAGSLEDGNHDMITILALVGLIVFSAFEGLSGMGRSSGTAGIDVPSEELQQFGPVVYGLLMAVTCFFSMVTYIRLRVAIGQRSLELDPTDRPFRPLRLTDSLLGYMLLAFLFTVSIHFLLTALLLHDEAHWGLLLTIDAVVFGLAIAAEQIALVIVGRRFNKV